MTPKTSLVLRSSTVFIILATALAGCSGSTNKASKTPTAKASVVATAPSYSEASLAPRSSSSQSAEPSAGTGEAKPGDPGYAVPETTPVALDATANAGDLSVRLASIEAVDGQAGAPGDIAGSAVKVSIEVTAGATAVDLSTFGVDAYYGADATPANPLTLTDEEPGLPATLEAGKSATATYIFTVPVDQRSSFTLKVSTTQGQPLTVFTGTAP